MPHDEEGLLAFHTKASVESLGDRANALHERPSFELSGDGLKAQTLKAVGE
jgi:hypothetical protein